MIPARSRLCIAFAQLSRMVRISADSLVPAEVVFASAAIADEEIASSAATAQESFCRRTDVPFEFGVETQQLSRLYGKIRVHPMNIVEGRFKGRSCGGRRQRTHACARVPLSCPIHPMPDSGVRPQKKATFRCVAGNKCFYVTSSVCQGLGAPT